MRGQRPTLGKSIGLTLLRHHVPNPTIQGRMCARVIGGVNRVVLREIAHAGDRTHASWSVKGGDIFTVATKSGAHVDLRLSDQLCDCYLEEASRID